jgi:LysR family transcriptional regulator, hydrogen peroxide-inducible genes activator
MDLCHLVERPARGEMADLRAASLETLLQLVGAGFGCTLVPALAIRGSWMTGSGIIARPLACPKPTGASPWSIAAASPAPPRSMPWPP